MAGQEYSRPGQHVGLDSADVQLRRRGCLPSAYSQDT